MQSANLPQLLVPGEKTLWSQPDIGLIHMQISSVLCTVGVLFLTNFRLVFMDGDHDGYSMSVPLTAIWDMTKRKDGQLDIMCKDCRVMRFAFPARMRKAFLDGKNEYSVCSVPLFSALPYVRPCSLIPSLRLLCLDLRMLPNAQ